MRIRQKKFSFDFTVLHRSLCLQGRPSFPRNKLSWRKENKRASNKKSSLPVVSAVVVLFNFAISVFILFGVVTKPEFSRRTLRQILSTIPNGDHAIGYVNAKFYRSIFTSPQKVSSPPYILFDNFAWEPDYNGLYFDSLLVSDIGPKMIDQNKAEGDDVNIAETHSDDCQTPSWTKLHFPVCNVVHETAIDFSQDAYLGHGYYRDVWLMHDMDSTDDNRKVDFVFKQSVLPTHDKDIAHLLTATSLSKIHKEALIMERLTSSPRIVNIYGHCGTSVIAEASEDSVAGAIVPNSGRANVTILDQLPSIASFNNFPPITKLDLAIEMSKAVADLHGFSGGIIIHGDIHPVQWLLSSKQRSLQLNDFNNAEILSKKINQPTAENETYCRKDRGVWVGNFRSPEEYLGDAINEKIDIYSMGNMLYSLLTGLWPFYDVTDYDEIRERFRHSERPHVDPRYFTDNHTFIERKMIEIMTLMWDNDPQNRPTIFEVADFLSNVKRQVHSHSSHRT